jgi:hypothetical protein
MVYLVVLVYFVMCLKPASIRMSFGSGGISSMLYSLNIALLSGGGMPLNSTIMYSGSFFFGIFVSFFFSL